ncbi:nitroreductase/quinone reductase family protein [Cellulomonas sp. McL0617]|uniref:nitroreductase/quinone reductase family protein n=1 Tax=Cellulomonas sp. McL0617 TaxID=3415675 RepID=UPI003CF10153
MAFDTPNGTRGARQPGTSPLERFGNRMMARRARGKGSFEGASTIALVTIGSKSGEERITPVAWFPAGGNSGYITATAGGAARNPAWYYNLAAHPDRVGVEVGGERVAVTASQLHGDERDEAWRLITARSNGFVKYEKATDRVIPVIRLTRR